LRCERQDRGSFRIELNGSWGDGKLQETILS
jgi:hypothetical protein